jgi:hypothetical protein
MRCAAADTLDRPHCAPNTLYSQTGADRRNPICLLKSSIGRKFDETKRQYLYGVQSYDTGAADVLLHKESLHCTTWHNTSPTESSYAAR